MVSRKRSFIKALSWRLLALLITMSVAWFIFRDARVAASVGIIDSLVKIAVYYLHERFWQRVSYGRPREPLDWTAESRGRPEDTRCQNRSGR